MITCTLIIVITTFLVDLWKSISGEYVISLLALSKDNRGEYLYRCLFIEIFIIFTIMCLHSSTIALLYGLSQVVFGIIGLLGSSIFVTFSLFLVRKIEKTRKVKPIIKILFIGVFSAWFFLLSIVVIGTQRFLTFIGIGVPKVNIEGHIYALIIGIIIGL